MPEPRIISDMRNKLDKTENTWANLAGKPAALPANGGNSDTTNNKQVLSNVPANAKFTDTVYVHPATHDISQISGLQNNLTGLQNKTSSLENNLSGLQSKTSSLENNLSGLQSKTTGLENNLSSLKSKTTGLENSLSGLQNKTADLESKIANSPKGDFEGKDIVFFRDVSFSSANGWSYSNPKGGLLKLTLLAGGNSMIERITIDGVSKMAKIRVGQCAHLQDRTNQIYEMIIPFSSSVFIQASNTDAAITAYVNK